MCCASPFILALIVFDVCVIQKLKTASRRNRLHILPGLFLVLPERSSYAKTEVLQPTSAGVPFKTQFHFYVLTSGERLALRSEKPLKPSFTWAHPLCVLSCRSFAHVCAKCFLIHLPLFKHLMSSNKVFCELMLTSGSVDVT